MKTHHNSQNMAISHTFDVPVYGEETFPTNLLILMIVSDFTLSNSILHGLGPRQSEKWKKNQFVYLDSIAQVSDPLINDLRHQIWNALLRLGHAVPCLEKQQNHSTNSVYCSFKGSVRSV